MQLPPRRGRSGRRVWRRTRRASAVLACALPSLAVPGCGGADDAAEPPSDPPVVEVVRVEPEPLVDTAVFSGQLDAEQSVMIRSELEGVVRSIEFEQGQRVEEGQILFRLRDGEQKARLREAIANRDLARQRWERARNLVSRDASSAAQADTAQAEYEVARARVDLARVELARTRIRAPFDGVVGQRHVDVGARVVEETELTRIDAVDRLQLTFGISDEGLPHARVGMKVKAWVRPYPGEKFPGEVFFVSPSLDPRNRRIWVKAWIDNGDGRLVPGLFANVDLEVRRLEEAIVVPESAIAIDQQGPYVWKLDEANRATRMPVEIGLRERGIVEILQGLPPGTRVVSAGIHKVSEGSEVRISDNPLVGRARQLPPEGTLIGEGT